MGRRSQKRGLKRQNALVRLENPCYPDKPVNDVERDSNIYRLLVSIGYSVAGQEEYAKRHS